MVKDVHYGDLNRRSEGYVGGRQMNTQYMVKGFAKSTVYAYRVTCFMALHSRKRQFNTVDECGILQLVAVLRRDLAQ